MKDYRKTHKPCSRCKGTGRIKLKKIMLDTDDVRKILLIMKQNRLNQLTLSKVLDISQGTINGWFYKKTNPKGTIKRIYFDILKLKGYPMPRKF